MRIVRTDLEHGIITVRPESPEDLWQLEKVLEPGCLVTARTLRKTAIKSGSEIKEGGREPMVLTLRLEGAAFQPDSGTLRLSGTIARGPERVQLHVHHTIHLERFQKLRIRKSSWPRYQIDKLKSLRETRPVLFICVLDRDEAEFAALRESGIQYKGAVSCKKIKGKEDDRTPYYQEILEALQQAREYQTILLAGPGFEKDNLLAFIKEEDPGLAKKCVAERSYNTGRSGIQEVLKTSANKVLQQTRVAQETAAVEEFLARLQKNHLVAYGPEQTGHALQYGAVQTLLISEPKVKQWEGLMLQAEKTKAAVRIISADHEAGERFAHFGVAGLLRFKVS